MSDRDVFGLAGPVGRSLVQRCAVVVERERELSCVSSSQLRLTQTGYLAAPKRPVCDVAEGWMRSREACPNVAVEVLYELVEVA